jgi:hypothetical protein
VGDTVSAIFDFAHLPVQLLLELSVRIVAGQRGIEQLRRGGQPIGVTLEPLVEHPIVPARRTKHRLPPMQFVSPVRAGFDGRRALEVVGPKLATLPVKASASL